MSNWDETDLDILEDIRDFKESMRKNTGRLPLSAIVQFVDDDGRVWHCTCPSKCEIHD